MLKRVLWTILFVFIIAISALYIFVRTHDFTSDKDEEDQLKFDKITWRDFHTKNYENARHYMLTDLNKNYLKKGVDSIYVIKLLGRPDARFGFSYNLGFYESGFDLSYLVIEFDKNGKLVNTKLQTI